MQTPGNAAEYEPPARSHIPLIGQPKWKRTITTQDVLPSPPPPPPPPPEGSSAPNPSTHATTKSSASFLSKRRSNKPTRPSGSPGPLIVEIDPAKERSPCNEESVAGPTPALAIASDFPLCSTCRTNEGRYTCPQCSAPYCSVDCYRIHDVPESARIGDGDNGATGGGRCTESFYRKRVEGITKLEIKGEDNAKAMRNLLARSTASNHSLSSAEDNRISDDMSNAAAAVTDEELLLLAEAMLGIAKAGDGTILDEGEITDDAAVALLESLAPHVREAFESSVRDGELSHLVSPWRPWWYATLNPLPAGDSGATNMPASSSDIEPYFNNCGDIEKFLPSPPSFGPSSSESEIGPTLDDRIVGIKRLHRGKAKANNYALQYNTIDLAFGVACTLRLYNGIPKQPTKQSTSSFHEVTERIESELDAANGAAETMLCSSLVLENDARFASVEEVMASCAESTIRLSKVNLCNTSWELLSKDLVAILSNGRRGVLRALLDGKDILRGGSKAAKMLPSAGIISAGTKSTSLSVEQLRDAQQKRYKMAQKKIEFYLSWCFEYLDEIFESEKLSEAAEAWIEQWEAGEGHNTLSVLSVSPTSKNTTRIAR